DTKDNDCDGDSSTDETGCQETPTFCPPNTNLCTDYAQTYCEDDPCKISSLEGGCSWNALAIPPSCNSYEIQINDQGEEITCYYEENIISNCEDSDFLEYSLTSLAPECEKKEPISIMCSSKTKLPLENKFGIILTILSIIGIYFLFFRKNKILKKEKK
ncbi:MAG: hypothetical protein AABX80_01620, partial [Nanoarchaeota archaeon]